MAWVKAIFILTLCFSIYGLFICIPLCKEDKLYVKMIALLLGMIILSTLGLRV